MYSVIQKGHRKRRNYKQPPKKKKRKKERKKKQRNKKMTELSNYITWKFNPAFLAGLPKRIKL